MIKALLRLACGLFVAFLACSPKSAFAADPITYTLTPQS